MTTTPQALTGQTWNPIAEAKTKYPGLASEDDGKIGEFLSTPQNFRSSFPEYAHLDDETIVRNMANVRAIAPLKTDVPANPILAPGHEGSNTGEHLGGGGGAARLPERQALVKEAGSPLAVPLAVGAHALESQSDKAHEQELSNAAHGVAPPVRAPAEADIATPENATIKGGTPVSSRVAPTMERMGADTLRAGASALTPENLAIASLTAGTGPAETAVAKTIRAGRVLTGAYQAAKSVPDVVENAPGMVRGEPEATKKTLNAAANVTGMGAMAAEGAPQTVEDLRPVAKTVKQAGENYGLALGVVKPEPVKALTQAIQPGVNIPRAQESMPIAGPDLQRVKQDGLVTDKEGNPLTEYKSNGDLLQGVKAAKNYIWDALEKRTGSVAKLQADTGVVADAMKNSISKRTAEQYPQSAKQIEARAETYRGLKSFRDIENAIQDANNDLRNYYKRSSPTDSPVGPETAATEAEVKALRQLLDDKVETLTGSGVADLKRRYGALRDVERAAAKQYAVETRVKGANLWEGLAALRAAGDFMSGNVLGAVKGGATLAIGRRLAAVRSPQYLINEAFQGKNAFEPSAPIPPPPGVKIAGALPAAGESQASHTRPEPGTGDRAAIAKKPEPPVSGPNAPPIDVDSGPGRGSIPPSGKPIITPRPGVEVQPGAPELKAGPEPSKTLPSGPEPPKQLPPARSIQLGPSSEPPPERRSPGNAEQRRRVSEMSPEELRKELMTSRTTELPNRRAFDEAGESKAVGMSDADGLKALNDKFGYEAGNALLKAKADALKAAGLDAYHDKGDEFLFRGESPETLNAKLEKARGILKKQVIEVTMNDGTTRRFKGADFSYGTSQDIGGAESALKEHKAGREASGERARGELRGITEIKPKAGANGKSAVEKPAPPTVKKAPEAKPGMSREAEINDLRVKMRALDKELSSNNASPFKMKPKIDRYRKLEARLNELQPPQAEKFGAASERREGGEQKATGEKNGATGAEPKKVAPTSNAKPISRAVRLQTYDSLPPEVKEYVDSVSEAIPKMPQEMRERTMRELNKFGGAGTFLKERLALEAMERLKKEKSGD